MVKVSYCSTCKGRLWQLKQTFKDNLTRLENIDAEWIILDFNCPVIDSGNRKDYIEYMKYNIIG